MGEIKRERERELGISKGEETEIARSARDREIETQIKGYIDIEREGDGFCGGLGFTLMG